MAVLKTPPIPNRLYKTLWKQLGWKPNPIQSEILLDQTRQQVLCGGRRVGKSETGAWKLIPEAFRAQGELKTLIEKGVRREFWIVGPEYTDSEKEFRKVWSALQRLNFTFDRPGSYNNPLSGEMRISMFGERFIVWAKSAKYPDTLVGEGLSGVVFSEAAKLKPAIWNKYIRPTMADFQGWAFLGSTPEGRNWFHDFWQEGTDPQRVDRASWRVPSWSNPHVYGEGVDLAALKAVREMRETGMHMAQPGIYADLRKKIDPEILSLFDDMGDEEFSQEVGAEWTDFVGKVFKDFDEETHVRTCEPQPGWSTWIAMDYGFTNPFCALLFQLDPHSERMVVLDEYYETQKTTDEAARELYDRFSARVRWENVQGFYPDPAEPDRTQAIANMLRIRPMSPGSLSVNDRVTWMRRWLKYHPEGDPKILFDRRCIKAIKDFGEYRYPKQPRSGTNPAENPEKKNDHAPEALGRFFSGRFGSPLTGGARQAKARVGRR